MSETSEVPEEVEIIKRDRSKALRAEKDIDDPHPDAADMDARTAVRYDRLESGVDMFQVVTTGLKRFPLGHDRHTEAPQNQIADWARRNDPKVIDASDEDWTDE